MKPRYWRFGLALVILLLAVVIGQRLLQMKNSREEVTDELSSVTNTLNQPASVRDTPKQSASTNTQASRREVFSSRAEDSDRGEKMRISVAEQNVPIAFWGKVVDQDNHPLPGVRLTLKVRRWNLGHFLNPESRFVTYEKETGSDGLFQITDARGDLLTVESAQKEGYEVSPRALKNYGYNISTNFSPDPTSPVIIKLWKKGLRSELIKGSKFYGIVPDGHSYTLDLINHRKGEGASAEGDLRVNIVRPPQVRPQTKYEWSFAIEAIGGGLLETEDEFMYRAPESGYVSRFERVFDPSKPDWRNEATLRLYLRSREGRVHARLIVEVLSDYNDKSIFNVSYALNASGSRNLE